MTIKGVILDRDSLGDDLDFSGLTNIAEWEFFASTEPKDTQKRIEEADIVLTNKVIINQTHMQQSQKLKYIGILATGTNNVDLKAAEKNGINVDNVTNYCSESLAQHWLCLALNLYTSAYRYHQDVAAGKWSESPFFCRLDYPIRTLANQTLLIVGYGTLGKAVEKIAKAFGINVLIAEHPNSSPRAGRVAFLDGLSRADIISLHCPLTPATENLIAKETIASMKDRCFIINTARGPLINEKDLLNALRSGKVAGAALDVLTTEPPPPDHILPRNTRDLNLIITPHIAWATKESRQLLLDKTTQQIAKFLN